MPLVAGDGKPICNPEEMLRQNHSKYCSALRHGGLSGLRKLKPKRHSYDEYGFRMNKCSHRRIVCEPLFLWIWCRERVV